MYGKVGSTVERACIYYNCEVGRTGITLQRPTSGSGISVIAKGRKEIHWDVTGDDYYLGHLIS